MGKLAVASRQFPPSLCINNIILPRFATAAGGFGDILDTEDSQKGNRRYCNRACTVTLSFYSVYNP